MTTILPVIHFHDENQAMRNAERVVEAGCGGLMLIEMSGKNGALAYIAGAIKRRWPGLSVGVNRLGEPAPAALGCNMAAESDATWTDAQLTHTGYDLIDQAEAVCAMLHTIQSYRPHQLFCAVAFKYQAEEPNPGRAARLAADMGFIPTTSGKATGHVADLALIEIMREAIGPDKPLAIASGITPENAPQFTPLVSHMLVATGVNSSFYEIDPARLAALMEAVRS